MGRLVDSIRQFLPRIRSVRTPLGGISWDPPSQITPNHPDTCEPLGSSTEPRENKEEVELSAHEVKVLVALAEAEEGELCVEDVADALGVTNIRAHYYLDHLADFGLVLEFGEDNEEPGFSLSPDGRAYLVENDLID